MKRARLSELNDNRDGHFLAGLLPGDFLQKGNLGFKKANQRSHDVGCECQYCDGKGRHVHEDCEVFILLQGKGWMEIDGKRHRMETGDIIVCEPGEDHHLVADPDEPCVNLCLHAGPQPHWQQE